MLYFWWYFYWYLSHPEVVQDWELLPCNGFRVDCCLFKAQSVGVGLLLPSRDKQQEQMR